MPIGARNVYFAVRKGRPDLMQRLARAYREYYIDHIDRIDALRAELLGIPKPPKRVRVAAYMRGDLFNVTPDGEKSGSLEMWMKSLCGATRWTPDFVYGGYDESIADVKSGRLDMIGGLGFDASRRNDFLFPHTPIGMLRVYLWTHPEKSQYKVGEPSTWKGMCVGMLAGTISAQRAKRQFDHEALGVKYREYATDSEMVKAYFEDEIDACIDVEMPDLSNEVALHLYASHPMYICTTTRRTDLFNELERALEEVCDDFPKYMRMISERHYGSHHEMAPLSLKEAEWLAQRRKDPSPVMVDFSPWPFQLHDAKGQAAGLAALLQAEIKRKTGLVIMPQEQTGLQTAQARFLRGETRLWIPYPVKAGEATYGATSVFSLPVPQTVGEFYGAEDPDLELEMFASQGTPPELVSILHKAVSSIDPVRLQEMFMGAKAERKVVHRVFGLTGDEMVKVILGVVLAVLAGIAIYGFVMIRLLKRQAARAKEAAAKAEEHAQAKTRFLAMMSHELRTPLNAVIGFAEFLSREDIDERRRKEYTDGILLSATALLELINDILDLSKLDAGAMEMRSGACDMQQLMRELPAIFGYRVRRHGVKLKIIGPASGGIPVLSLSQQGMRQILINLVGNAAKFTEEGEIRVEIGWDAEPHTLKITVSDTGCGISKSKMERLFDPFVQDIASRMNASGGEMKGTGLGLPIVKRMVDNAHGTVKADSTPGKGTSFEIVIPGLDIAEGVSAAALGHARARAGGGRHGHEPQDPRHPPRQPQDQGHPLRRERRGRAERDEGVGARPRALRHVDAEDGRLAARRGHAQGAPPRGNPHRGRHGGRGRGIHVRHEPLRQGHREAGHQRQAARPLRRHRIGLTQFRPSQVHANLVSLRRTWNRRTESAVQARSGRATCSGTAPWRDCSARAAWGSCTSCAARAANGTRSRRCARART